MPGSYNLDLPVTVDQALRNQSSACSGLLILNRSAAAEMLAGLHHKVPCNLVFKIVPCLCHKFWRVQKAA